jgi:hypothetical protein
MEKEQFYLGLSVTHSPMTKCLTDIDIEKTPKSVDTTKIYGNTYVQNMLLKVPKNSIKQMCFVKQSKLVQNTNQEIKNPEVSYNIKPLMGELKKTEQVIDFSIYLNFNDYILSATSYHLSGKLSEDGLIAFWILLNKLNYIGMCSEL